MRDSIIVKHDTIFSTRLQYDSTYIDRYHTMIAIDSVIYIRDSVTQTRYHKVRDSIYIHKTDTMWLNHTITKTKQIPRKRIWFDYVGYAALAILIVLIIRKAKNTLF